MTTRTTSPRPATSATTGRTSPCASPLARSCRRSTSTSRSPSDCSRAEPLFQAEGLDAIGVYRLVQRIDAVGQRLQQAEQCRVRADEARAVGAVIEALVGVAGQL